MVRQILQVYLTILESYDEKVNVSEISLLNPLSSNPTKWSSECLCYVTKMGRVL